MTFTGLYIIIFFFISEFFNFNKINLAILIGLIIPDLDVILKYLNIHVLFHGSIFHSIIFIVSFYLLLLIMNEIKTKKINNIIINSIFLGMLFHIIFDILLSVGPIIFYWPLPIASIDPLYILNLNNEILYIVGISQFLLLRFFAHKLIIKIINKRNLSDECYNTISIISLWMRYQILIILTFVIMYSLRIQFSTILMDFYMFSSMSIALYFLYKLRELTRKDIIIG